MQADEIIQNKEWANLNEEEKSCISELASTEGEFYLLKQMMNVSAEEAFDVPKVSLSVKENIIGEITKKPLFKIQKYWYLAAAAIIAFGFMTFLLFQSKPKDDFVKETKVPEVPFQKTPEIVAPLENKNEKIVKDEIKGNQTNEVIIPNQKRPFKNNIPVDTKSLAIKDYINEKDDFPYLVSNNNKNRSAEESISKVSSINIESKKIESNYFAKEQSLASNNSVNKNKDFLNLITEIF